MSRKLEAEDLSSAIDAVFGMFRTPRDTSSKMVVPVGPRTVATVEFAGPVTKASLAALRKYLEAAQEFAPESEPDLPSGESIVEAIEKVIKGVKLES